MSLTEQEVEKRFVTDVANHSIEIKHDDGVYRHVTFSNNGSSILKFSLVTFPGHLVYTGDMGTFVFCRLFDMFEFFRHRSSSPNYSYWHQKLEAVDYPDGSRERSIELFRENLMSRVSRHGDDCDECDEECEETCVDKQSLLELVEEACERWEYDGPDAAYAMLRDSSFAEDFTELSDTVYTVRFLWACNAIQWGVRQYDSKAASVSAAEPVA
jgi:hypothetical protein